jgi:hypothetical protein
MISDTTKEENASKMKNDVDGIGRTRMDEIRLFYCFDSLKLGKKLFKKNHFELR